MSANSTQAVPRTAEPCHPTSLGSGADQVMRWGQLLLSADTGPDTCVLAECVSEVDRVQAGVQELGGVRAEAEARLHPRCYQSLGGNWAAAILGFAWHVVSPRQRSYLKEPGGLPWWYSGWNSACQRSGCGFDPWSRKIPRAERLKALCHNC